MVSSPRHRRRAVLASASLGAALALSACAVGPDYKRPAVTTPPAFKEAQGWTAAVPADGVDRGDWWTLFGDPVLNELEARIDISNQTLKASEAAYRQARALVAEDRATLFPSLDLTGSGTRSQRGATLVTGANGASATVTSPASNSYQGALGASWEPDLWGKLRRTVA